jgi:hypothetical protein
LAVPFIMRIASERRRFSAILRSGLAIDFTTAASASRETEETGLAFNVQPHRWILFMHAVLLPSLPDRLCSSQLSFSPQRNQEVAPHGRDEDGVQPPAALPFLPAFTVEIDDDELRRQDVMRHRDRPAVQSHRICWR